MKNSFLLYLLLFSSISCTTNRPETQFDSQDHLTMATLWYQRSAEMRALYYQAFNLARIVVDQNLSLSDIEKRAVVLDIDETVLDNSPFQAEMILQNKPYSADLWHHWTKQSSATSLPGSLEFCRYLFEKGIEIFYISNRSIRELESSLYNLAELGFPYADPDHLLLKDTVSSKRLRRQKVSQNHDVILLIGDNLNDFSEIFETRSENFGFEIVDKHANDFGSRFIILPNPMYGAWESALNPLLKETDSSENQTRLKLLLRGYSEIN